MVSTTIPHFFSVGFGPQIADVQDRQLLCHRAYHPVW